MKLAMSFAEVFKKMQALQAAHLPSETWFFFFRGRSDWALDGRREKLRRSRESKQACWMEKRGSSSSEQLCNDIYRYRYRYRSRTEAMKSRSF